MAGFRPGGPEEPTQTLHDLGFIMTFSPAAPFFLKLGMDLGEDLETPFADASGREWNAFDEHTAGEVMSRRILSLPPDVSVRHAAQVMLSSGVHRLLVIEAGQLVGLLSTTDVLRAVAEGIGGYA